MTYNREEKKIVSHSSDDIKEIEDALARLQQVFRDIRGKMRDSNMTAVDLSTGTFKFYLDRMEPMVKKFMGKCEKQAVMQAVKRKREEYNAKKAGNKK